MSTILLVGVKLAGETMWSREVCHPRATPPWPRTRRGTQKTESSTGEGAVARNLKFLLRL